MYVERLNLPISHSNPTPSIWPKDGTHQAWANTSTHRTSLSSSKCFFFYFSQAFNYNPPRITFVVILDFGFYWLALLRLFASNRMCFRGRRGSCLLRYPKWFILHWGTWRNSVFCRARLAPNWDGLKSMDSPSSLAFAEGSWGASLWCMLRCFEDPKTDS